MYQLHLQLRSPSEVLKISAWLPRDKCVMHAFLAVQGK